MQCQPQNKQSLAEMEIAPPQIMALEVDAGADGKTHTASKGARVAMRISIFTLHYTTLHHNTSHYITLHYITLH